MEFEILTALTDIEIIAAGHGVEIRRYLDRTYGNGRWRKMKGKATIQLANGIIRNVELHWYEAQGIGRRAFKVKRYLK